MNFSEHNKLTLAARYWLIGKASVDSRFLITLNAFNISQVFHKGVRKDGVTQEFYHQINIFSYLRTLESLMSFPELVLATALLHDTYEDYEESHEILRRDAPLVYEYVVRVSKVRDGEKIPYQQYFEEMSNCPITSVVKIVDRIHNLSTMNGVFSTEKKKQYIQDVYDYFYPMIKVARRKFPEQEALYEQLKSTLTLLVKSIEYTISVEEKLQKS